MKALERNDIEQFIALIQSTIASMPYTITQENEAYYHSIFYLIASLIGAKIDSEVLTNKGRIDAMIECDEAFYIIEFKYSGKSHDLNTRTEEAIKQIDQKKYYEKFLSGKKKIYLLGIAFFEKNLSYRIKEI
jgi:hypothetical protein